MTTNSLASRFNNKSLWHFATVCGFTVGWTIGWAIILYLQSLPWMEILFWVIPSGGAGLGMGLGQWMLMRRSYKNAALWIPTTAIGFIATIGGILLLTMITNAFFEGSIPAFFKQFVDWFTPWLILLAAIAPAAIIIGPLCQWLIIRNALSRQPFVEILKMCGGWIFATLLLGFLLFFIESVFHSRSIILNLLIFCASAVPSGLIFAQATIDANRLG